MVRDFDGFEGLCHDVTVSRAMGGEGAYVGVAPATDEALDREALRADRILWKSGQDAGEGPPGIILQASAQHADVSPAQVEVASEGSNQSRFPRSIRSYEGHDLAFRDIQ